MTISDVVWAWDHHGKPVLELRLDGHPLYVRSSQRTELTRRGIVEGVVFLDSERGSLAGNPFMHADLTSELGVRDLIGCTDDPGVFALYLAMCDAIRDDTWRAGPRPVTA